MKMLLLCCIVAASIATTVVSEYTCVSECPDILSLSEHEAMCCNSSNHGKMLTVHQPEGRRGVLFCPTSMPSVCGSPSVYSSCADVLAGDPATASGYYDITLANGSSISVYCDMEGANCNGEGGWMRIANVDLQADPNAACPAGFVLTDVEGGRLCYQETKNAGDRCDSAFFSSNTLSYSKVCGRVRGYRDGSPHSFQSGSDIDSSYVDGVSITYGSSPRQHLWTYAAGFSDGFASGHWSHICPCNIGNSFEPPSFVGAHHYCETASASRPSLFDDPLWDNMECQNNESPCCDNSGTIPTTPWFVRTLGQSTSSDVELRVCANAFSPFRDVPLDLIELYVM